MPEIILKDKSGTEQTYDYKKVSFRTPTEGEKAEFIFPNFAELEVTENGEYSVPEGVDGYTKVKANVPVPTLITDAQLELDFSDGDMPISAPDGYAFTGGTIIKPETLIPENIAKDIVIAGIVGTHEGGGGAVEGTATVTFCNYDGTELFSRLVFVGDDCPDPIEQGKIDEPTRESTAQYNYTYSGWSLTAGGTASASALNAVTGDRTVYAVYTANVRYYTITYYDSDGATILHSEQLSYGATPNYTASKDGFSFIGWNPSLDIVTGDASYTAEWQEKITFAGASWADIARISESGQAEEYFNVGDTKSISFGEYTMGLAIAGFNHDDLADGSGKAGMTIIFTDLTDFTVDYSFTSTYSEETTLRGMVKPLFSSELQTVIKTVKKDFSNTTNSGTDNLKYADVELFALSPTEINLTPTNSNSTYYTPLGSTYALFASNGSFNDSYRTICSTGAYGNAWLRSRQRLGTLATHYVTTNQKVTFENNSANSYHLLLGFCI